MRVLLDECLPRRLADEFGEHEVRTVPQADWSGKTNGELIELAEAHYDVFVTIDRGFAFQQNLSGRRLSVVGLAAASNRFDDLRPLMPEVLSVLKDIGEGQFLRLGA
jgi:predicted nuclease of predicted toxin-antitoxin system